MLISISYKDPFEINLGAPKLKEKDINVFQVVEVSCTKKGCKVKMSDGSSYELQESREEFKARCNVALLEVVALVVPAPAPAPPPAPPGPAPGDNEPPEPPTDEKEDFFTAKRGDDFQL